MSEPEIPDFPVKGMKVVPYGYPLMTDAWAGCMMWAIGNTEIRAKFAEETKLSIDDIVNQRGFAKLIDEATGYKREVLIRFLDWATERVWGLDEPDIPEPPSK